MRAVTLRNLPPKLDRSIRQHARQKRISLNKAVISLLEEHLGIVEKKAQVEYDDLDALAGSWSETEAAAFDTALAKQRAIDPNLWK